MPSRFNGYIKSLQQLRKTRLTVDNQQSKIEQLSRFEARTEAAEREAGQVAAAVGNAVYRLPSKVLFADDIHINKRNFTSLYSLFSRSGADVAVGISLKGESVLGRDDVTPEKLRALVNAAGTYDREDPVLAKHRSILDALDGDALIASRHHHVPLFAAAQYEALCKCLPEIADRPNAIAKTEEAVFDFLWSEHRDVLINCCAAARFWAETWSAWPDLTTRDAVFVFSGAPIYCQVLLRIMRFNKADTYVLETFTNGQQYFCERRHSALPNASRVRQPNVYRQLVNSFDDADHLTRAEVRATNRIINTKNKNVKQPPPAAGLEFGIPSDIVLIAGQVINDYSIISGCGTVLSTLPVYKKLIETLLTDERKTVVFKAHPWELERINVERSLTLETLTHWARDRGLPLGERLFLVSDYNLSQLLKLSGTFITLNSQAAFEAAIEGLKPVTIGGAFYDVAGFTDSFSDATSAAEAVLRGDAGGTLHLDQYMAFSRFLAALSEEHLFEIGDRGRHRLKRLLAKYAPEAITSIHQNETEANSFRANITSGSSAQ
ncbi:MAG: hypothetical protein AAGK37_17520 [Pseudomonadota bacterium]